MAGSKGSYSVTFSATDKISGVIANINKKLAASQAPFNKLKANVEKFGKLSGMTKLAGGFKQLGSASHSAFTSMARIIEPLGAITGAATLGGMARLIDQWGQLGRATHNTGIILGLTSTKLSNMQGAGQLNGISAESFNSSFERSSDVNRAVRLGTASTDQKRDYQNFGINAKDDDTTNYYKQIDAIKKLHDQGGSAAAVRSLASDFGFSEDQIPMLEKGSKFFKQQEAEAAKYGKTTERNVMEATKFANAMDKLKMSVQGVLMDLAGKIGPILTPKLTQLADWIATSPAVEKGITEVAKAIKQIVDAISKTDFKALFTKLDGYWNKVDGVVKKLGGWKDVLIGIVAVDLLAPFAGVALAIAGISLQVAALGVKMAGLGAPIVAAGAGAAVATKTSPLKKLGKIAGALPLIGAAYEGGVALGDVIKATTNVEPFLDKHMGFVGKAMQWSGLAGTVPEAAMTRGLRNNNPLNLSYLKNQEGVTGSDGRFGQFANMTMGVQAAEKQLLRYQDSGTDTLSKMIAKWAPANENDTAQYIKNVGKWSGLDANTKLNMRDPEVAGKVISAMSRMENGAGLQRTDVMQGISQALAGPGNQMSSGALAALRSSTANLPGLAANAPAAIDGKVAIHVKVDAPQGTTVHATSTGRNVNIPRIARAMPGAATG